MESSPFLKTTCPGEGCKLRGGLCSHWNPYLLPKPINIFPNTAGIVLTDDRFHPQQLHWCRFKFKAKTNWLKENNARRLYESYGCFLTIHPPRCPSSNPPTLFWEWGLFFSETEKEVIPCLEAPEKPHAYPCLPMPTPPSRGRSRQWTAVSCR